MNTWGNGIEPSPEEITKLNTIESVINNLFESPTYGTRQPITNPEVIKAMISLIQNNESLIHPKHKKMSLYFKGEHKLWFS